MGSFVPGDKIAQIARLGAIALGCLALAHCAASRVDPKYGVSSSSRVVDAGEPVPKGGGTYRVGKPYVIAGRTYVPEENTEYRSEGVASWYGDDFHGRLTANGEVYDMHSISAAHPTLPMPSYVRVTNLANKRSIVVRVNDRGPYAADRIIDLSVKAAQLLGFHGRGLAKVRVEYVGRAPLEGSDDRQLLATLREGDPAPAPSVVRVASAKPFLPDSFGPEPSATAQKAVPSPQTRPFTLGEAPAQPKLKSAEPKAAIETAALPPPARPASLTPGAPANSAAAIPTIAPVSAFAPTRYDAPAASFSGRGLY